MPIHVRSSALRGVVLTGMALLAAMALAIGGCKSIDKPNVTEATSTVSGKTVEATMTPGGTIAKGTWPAKVGEFAASFKGATWYPAHLPANMPQVSLDVVELNPGDGLVCDMVRSDGKKYIELMQGSPKGRTYAIVSSGKVAWGSAAKADIVYDDPKDLTSAVTIVYSDGHTLAELSGDVGLAELKEIAASMGYVGSRRP